MIEALGGGGAYDSDDGMGRKGRLRVGSKVKARYRGKSKFYPGVISRDRGDGTFDIDYDDGEHETRVREDLIEALGGSGNFRSVGNTSSGLSATAPPRRVGGSPPELRSSRKLLVQSPTKKRGGSG